MTETRHRVVAQALRTRIASGDWPVGTRLPPEIELADNFGVSRATLRRAFTDLEAEQLIERRRRVGTTVIAQRPQQRFRMITDGLEDLLSLTRDTELRIDSTARVPDPGPNWRDAPSSLTGEWLEVYGSRYLPCDMTPFGRSRVLVTGRYADIDISPDASVGSVFTLIEERYAIRVTRVRQSATATACTQRDARLLGLEEHAPVMRIDATLFDPHDNVVELSTAIFDPARFRMRTDVRLE